MQQTSNLDYLFLLKEIEELKGERLENVYQLGEKKFCLRFKGKDLVAELGEYAFLASRTPAPKVHPPAFVMLFRKHLRNARLTEAVQPNFDRLFELRFSNGFVLVFEMFSKGNLVLLDEERRIVRPFKFQEFASRKLKPGQEYKPPPLEKIHPLELNELPGEGEAVRSLSKHVALSPFYLEEACARAGVAFDQELGDLPASKKKALLEALKSLLGEGKAREARVYFSEGKPVAFAPFELKKLEGVEVRLFASFSQALEAFYSGQQEAVAAGKGKKDFVLVSQEAAVKEFAEKEARARRNAEWLQENTVLVQELLEAARKKKPLQSVLKRHGFKGEARLSGKKLVLQKK